jgi:large subunit ribosomal protein L7/L12
MPEKTKIDKQLANLTVKEVNELAEILKDEYGIEPASAAVAIASSKKKEFDIILKESGNSKLAVVKLVKELTGLGLKDAKALVDEVPTVIKHDVSVVESFVIKQNIEKAGGIVEISGLSKGLIKSDSFSEESLEILLYKLTSLKSEIVDLNIQINDLNNHIKTSI